MGWGKGLKYIRAENSLAGPDVPGKGNVWSVNPETAFMFVCEHNHVIH